MSEIYKMKLHDFIYLADGKFTVLRVAGGWLYTIYRLDSGQMNSVFVPFDNEFQEYTHKDYLEGLQEGDEGINHVPT